MYIKKKAKEGPIFICKAPRIGDFVNSFVNAYGDNCVGKFVPFSLIVGEDRIVSHVELAIFDMKYTQSGMAIDFCGFTQEGRVYGGYFSTQDFRGMIWSIVN